MSGGALLVVPAGLIGVVIAASLMSGEPEPVPMPEFEDPPRSPSARPSVPEVTRAFPSEPPPRPLPTGRLSGTVRLVTGAPAAGATVEAVTDFGSRPAGIPTVTDGDGRFEVRGLRPRTDYRLHASGRTSDGIELYPGRTRPSRVGSVDVVIEVAPADFLKGIVVDEAGVPLAGITVDAMLNRRKPAVTTETDERGAFSLRVYPGKKYTLRARVDTTDHRGFEWAWQWLEGVELTEAGDLTGTLLKPSGEPAGRWWFQLYHETLNVKRTSTTKKDGTFHIRRVPAGTWRVECRRQVPNPYGSGPRYVTLVCGRVTTGVEGTVLRMPEPR